VQEKNRLIEEVYIPIMEDHSECEQYQQMLNDKKFKEAIASFFVNNNG
jgi:hypothetical protein